MRAQEGVAENESRRNVRTSKARAFSVNSKILNLGCWYKEIRDLANITKSDLTIYIQDIDPSDHKSAANAINSHLATFS